MLATLSGHDRTVLRAEVEPLIEELLPAARYAELLDVDWRPALEREARYNAAAREFVLAEVI